MPSVMVMKIQLKRVKALRPSERDLVRRVLVLLRRGRGQVCRQYEAEIKSQLVRLDLLARTLHESPSVYREQQIGDRRRDVFSLIEALSHCTVFDFEMHMPMRALVGRTLLMAKLNFFRMARHILTDAVPSSASVQNLRVDVERRLCTYIYTKIAEEILARICVDTNQEADFRRKAVALICQIWEHRLSYQVSDFFPILESVWEARRQAKVVFGTLMGTSELFELMRNGCDDRFIDLFSGSNINPDQRLAFQEFLFMTGGPELDRLREHVETGPHSAIGPDEAASVLQTPRERFDLSSLAAEKMYESFRRRGIAALTRRFRGGAGASRTAEEYIMLHMLEKLTLEELVEAHNLDAPKPA
ncbi:MAG: hypothetical protein BIFFINMI_01412 [Phycisphaerae bacterium]|nr:hypothetical protein [Phycisphaerae bacterium]